MKKGVAASAFLISAFVVLTVGCGTNSRTDCGTDSRTFPLVQLSDANGVQSYGIVPPSYRPDVASRWVLYNHGLGQSGRDISTNPHDRCLVNALVEAGYVVIASDYKGRNCWGNSQCVTDIAAVQERWKAYLNLRRAPYVISESMGGIVTWNAISHGTLSPLRASEVSFSEATGVNSDSTSEREENYFDSRSQDTPLSDGVDIAVGL